jgi:peptide/nickel transport system ATP-binding protein
MTVVFITHDIGLAYYVSDVVYIMERASSSKAGVLTT